MKGLVRFKNNFNGTTFHRHFYVKTGVKDFFWYLLLDTKPLPCKELIPSQPDRVLNI